MMTSTMEEDDGTTTNRNSSGSSSRGGEPFLDNTTTMLSSPEMIDIDNSGSRFYSTPGRKSDEEGEQNFQDARNEEEDEEEDPASSSGARLDSFLSNWTVSFSSSFTPIF